MVFLKPSSKDTLGSQFNSFLALLISGLLFFGSSSGKSKNWIFDLDPVKERIFFDVKKGGTGLDIVIFMVYKFTKDELEALNDIVSRNPKELSPALITTRVFAESILTFNIIISESAGCKYTMMLNEVKFLKKKGEDGQIIYMELCARPHE